MSIDRQLSEITGLSTEWTKGEAVWELVVWIQRQYQATVMLESRPSGIVEARITGPLTGLGLAASPGEAVGRALVNALAKKPRVRRRY